VSYIIKLRVAQGMQSSIDEINIKWGRIWMKAVVVLVMITLLQLNGFKKP
jgi:hypothetical protein